MFKPLYLQPVCKAQAMKASIRYCILFLAPIAGFVAGCGHHRTHTEKAFTKIDSLTETYLTLQDSILIAWNQMANDENKKLNSLHELVHGMMNSNQFDKTQIIALDQRLEQLKRIRFTQKSMINPYVVDEYDFASNALISEIISLAESSPSFSQESGYQSIIDYVKLADQRMAEYRSSYDSVTLRFNLFIEQYHGYLKEIDEYGTTEKMPLFQVAGN